MRKKLILTMLTLTLAVALLVGGTMAWFTADDEAGEATFTAGILGIDVSDGLGNTIENEIGPIDNMNPGDVYEPIEINIVNTGTKKLAWFGDWTFTPEVEGYDKLLDAIYIDSMKMEFLKLDENGEPISNANWEVTDHFIKDGKGNQPSGLWYNSLIDPEWEVITLKKWNDTSAMNSVPYEHIGALKPGYAYRLTVKFGFNKLADDDYQGNAEGVSPITIGFNVKATQVHMGALADEIGQTNNYNWFNEQLDKQQ